MSEKPTAIESLMQQLADLEARIAALEAQLAAE